MTTDDALVQLAAHHGIFPEFKDMAGVVHQTTADTYLALLRANGLDIASERDVKEQLQLCKIAQEQAYTSKDIVVRTQQKQAVAVTAEVDWQVLSEADGGILAEGRAATKITLPALSAGVHCLTLQGPHGRQEVNLIVAPDRAPSVLDVTGQDRTWGVTAALYGLRSDRPKTIADFEDLASFAHLLGGKGAAFLGINPVHALGEAAAETISPYSPVHRGFLNTDHIALEQVEPFAQSRTRIDYAAHRRQHRARLRDAFSDFTAGADDASRLAFAAFCQDGGGSLCDFARFEVLSQTLGPDARLWPAEPPDREIIDSTEIGYVMWMQWLADKQLAAAQQATKSSGMTLGLYLDLAVGARLGGAESWGQRSAAAQGVSLGAPPDHLSPAGQNWQLAALSPRRLQAGNYEAFRFVLRQNMRHAGVLRIDHALGLNRSFWLPEDGSPGGYIRQNYQSLMAIIAIEAQKAGTVIVGEDLGLVPEGFREELADRGFYGYSVLQYEKDARGKFLPASKLRPQSLACFGTHDTPTLEGFWQGRDIAWWQKLGWIDTKEAARATDQRAAEKRQLARAPAAAPLPKRAGAYVRDSLHADIANSPAALVAVQLDDTLGLEEAQNLPGTVDEHPNWRRVYLKSLSEIENSPDLKKTADIMAKAGRATKTRREET